MAEKVNHSTHYNKAAPNSEPNTPTTPPLTPSTNGNTKEKPRPTLNDEQKEFASMGLKAGVTPGEIGIVIALAEIRGITPLEMQARWLDYKTGIKQVALEDMRKHGIIIPV